MELNNTTIEDMDMRMKNFTTKHGSYKQETDKLEASIREQLDII